MYGYPEQVDTCCLSKSMKAMQNIQTQSRYCEACCVRRFEMTENADALHCNLAGHTWSNLWPIIGSSSDNVRCSVPYMKSCTSRCYALLMAHDMITANSKNPTPWGAPLVWGALLASWLLGPLSADPSARRSTKQQTIDAVPCKLLRIACERSYSEAMPLIAAALSNPLTCSALASARRIAGGDFSNFTRSLTSAARVGWFSHVQEAPRDPILGVTERFLQDPNPDKINLGVVRCLSSH